LGFDLVTDPVESVSKRHIHIRTLPPDVRPAPQTC
jgi:hypothetical protein